jgi:hypothetical protein
MPCRWQGQPQSWALHGLGRCLHRPNLHDSDMILVLMDYFTFPFPPATHDLPEEQSVELAFPVVSWHVSPVSCFS